MRPASGGLVERPLPPRACITTEPSRMYTNTMRVMPVDRVLRLLMTIFSCGMVEVIAHLPGLQTAFPAGTPWEGTEYHEGDKAVWTMSYAPR
jgi:hypothetical protein